MLDQDLKDLWQGGGTGGPQIHVNPQKIMQEVAAQAEYLEETIRKRDRRELWAAYALIPISVGLAFWFTQPLVKLSWALTVPCCLLLIYQLRRGARFRVTDFSVPLGQYLHQYHRYLQAQITMLRRVVWWYVLPFSLCQFLYYIGLGREGYHVWVNLAVVAVINYVIYCYNQKTVREDLQPLLEKVEQALANLEA